MSNTAFFTQNALPVFASLSADSKGQLADYLLSGNTAFREKRLLEFFKTLDWLGPEEKPDERPLHKLSPSLRRQLGREIEDYRHQKALNRSESAEKREDYRLRVFEYFRIKMPPADKALLESLRDYELDLTGRDVNWRHYFTLDSFKKIDAFRHAGPTERQALFASFRQDVDTYKKNYDKLHAPPRAETGFTFDDWCDWMGDVNPKQARQQQARPDSAAVGNPVYRAFHTLQVDARASRDEVRRQFRKLTLSHHPDLPEGNAETMKAIIGAYEEIKRYWQAEAQAL